MLLSCQGVGGGGYSSPVLWLGGKRGRSRKGFLWVSCILVEGRGGEREGEVGEVL